MIAGLSIPWGSSKGDEELGGYHLVWTRDLVKSATALLAAGDPVTALRAVVYLAVSQRADGGFSQNFWIDGRPYWSGVQLDEVSFPLVLVWRLKQIDALGDFDPAPMVTAACGFLIREGPATAQDRWEEAGGYSPSTLAINIAALVCAADLMRAAGDAESEQFILEYADFLESHVEAWTVTTEGSLVAGVPRHYIRINPNVEGSEDPNTGTITLANQPPEGPYEYPARDVVDAGFLELVRYGVRDPRDSIVEDSLRVVDAVLRVETPYGPCWRRYNHDGYGQRADGSAYSGWGIGRLWPLLTGERGHYELAAGRDAKPFLRTIEKLAMGIGLIPEQIWDQAPIPEKLLRFGGPTGAAIPLAWAHAEYLALTRSAADNRVFELIEPVRARYVGRGRPTATPIEIWTHKRPVERLAAGHRLRIIASGRFILRLMSGGSAQTDVQARATRLGVWYADIPEAQPGATISFEIYLLQQNRWDDRQYVVHVTPAALS
jgi:glucoamylase